MTLNGWIQIAIYFVVLTALVVPLGRYMARVFEGERTFLSPVLGPVERGLYRISRHRRDARAALDHLYGRHAAVQRRGLCSALRAAAASGCLAAQSGRHVGRGARPHLQHRGQLHQQHQLAELRRREHAQLSDADGGAHHPEFRFGGDRHRACRGADPRLRARLGQDRRQFLGRSHPLHALRAAAAVHHRCACSSCGRACRRTSAPMSTRPRSRAPSRP